MEPAATAIPTGSTTGTGTEQQLARREWLKCSLSPEYFIHNYVQIYDAVQGTWIPFHLWPDQVSALDLLKNNRKVVILKARQLGLTWLCLGYILWLMLFRPAKVALLFSRRETEAIYLLDERLKGMYKRLPRWMQSKQVLADSAHVWSLSNGSIAYGFPTTAGDSYTASVALVDEADLVPDLDALLRAVKPTIDAGGMLILLSRSDKTKPVSTFKKIFRGAIAGRTDWKGLFIPWYARPDRTQEWYEALKADVIERTAAIDELYEQYPATPEEALAAATLDKRIPAEWLEACYKFAIHYPSSSDALPVQLPNLRVYKLPEFRHQYMIGIDPAEGNPNSDDSVATVLDIATLEEVASLAGKIEPTVFAFYCQQLAEAYNRAHMQVERNNHGHVVIATLEELSPGLVENGPDGKPGWFSTGKGKAIMYATVADLFHKGYPTIHSDEAYQQLMSVEGATLEAPVGEHDDFAISFSLALVGARPGEVKAFAYKYTQWSMTKKDATQRNNRREYAAKSFSVGEPVRGRERTPTRNSGIS